MRNRASAWLVSSASFMVFGATAWPLPRLLGVDGGRAWVLRGGLLVLGAAAAVLLLVFLLKRARQAPATSVGASDIDHTLATAEARLAAAGSTADSKLGRRPVAIVLGAAGSTKTSIVTHCGLDPELLAGEVMRGDTVIPTDPMNVWYADGTVFVEAGGALLDDTDRWAHFARRLRPSRLAAAFGRGRQAPRMAILCIACDEFSKPGASQSLATQARLIRTRLAELSQQLGIRLPVYVIFTRADRLPYFADYVRSFNSDEAQQVLGATLPVLGDTGGTWAEREARRLNEAFARIVHAMSLRRLHVLPRETQDAIRAGAYEFPRELRKIGEPAIQLMLDVFRPSQLGVNPFLRGFYFTGVRPIVLRDMADAPVARPGPSPMDAGATSVFNAAMLQQAAQNVPVMSTSGRKVPQWVFLKRLFREVLLRDDVAVRITGSGTRVDLLRRGLIASAAAACLVLALGFTWSFAANRSMIRETALAMEQSRDVGALRGSASEEELARLEPLREAAARLSSYQRAGRPTRLGWGLYTGDDIHPHVRRAYFARFDAAMWGSTRDRLSDYLRNLPAEPTPDSDFGRAQDALAAYLITARDTFRSSAESLTPTLLRFWLPQGASDTLQVRAARHFAFFADELPHGNPFDADADQLLVSTTQNFLLAFGPEAYYQALIFEANSAAEPGRYTGPAGVVRNDYIVPGAFTHRGAQNVEQNLDNVEELFVKYEWIYGTGTPREKPNRAQLQSMYESDRVRHWQNYLRSASVAPFASQSDAASKLRVLADNSSPLVAMLAVAARETPLDTVTPSGRAFQPLHATVAVADDRGAGVNLLNYMTQLSTLESQMSLLSGGSTGGADQASITAGAIDREVRVLAGSHMATGAAAATSSEIQRLLKQPAEYGLSLLRRMPSEGVNAAGSRFCDGFAPLQRKYPFNQNSGDNASAREIAEFFRPGEGALWAFHRDNLSSLISQQGRPIGSQSVRADFQRFISRSNDLAEALFGTGGSALIVFDFQPIQYPDGATEVVLELNRQSTRIARDAPRRPEFPWSPESHQGASLSLRFGSEEVAIARETGPWAIIRIFRNTRWQEENGRWTVTWDVPGHQPFKASVTLRNNERPILRPDFFNDLRCSGRILN
jgi:type VI secretion system protein ImpL